MFNENDLKDISQCDFTEDDVKRYLARPDSFGLSPRADHYEEMFKTWSLGPVVLTRDSEVLDRSNHKALMRELKRLDMEDEWTITGCRHWAVGWVEHLSFRVLDDRGEVTDFAKWVKGWFDSLESYPIADESLFSEMEEEERYEYYSNNSRTRKAHIKTLKHEFELSKPTVRWLKKNWGVIYRLVGDRDSDDIYREDWSGTSDYWTRDRLAKELRDHHRWAYEDKVRTERGAA